MIEEVIEPKSNLKVLRWLEKHNENQFYIRYCLVLLFSFMLIAYYTLGQNEFDSNNYNSSV